MNKIKDWSTVNFRNFSFIVLLLIVLGISFGVVRIVGLFDNSSMYNSLVNGIED